jgi:hypothetical protein
MAAMAEIPRNRGRWALSAELVVVGVLMMVIGTFRQSAYASAVRLQLGRPWPCSGHCMGSSGCWSGITERVPGSSL